MSRFSSLTQAWQRWPDSARQLVQVVALLFLALLPHLAYLPVWIPLCLLVTSLWRVHIEITAKALPARWLRNLLAVLLLAPLLVSAGGFNGFEAGSALLTLMAGMKLLETRSTRDHRALVLAVLFLLFAAVLYQQSLAMLPYLLLCAWYALVLLMQLSGTTLISGHTAWKHSGVILLQALPLTAVLFVLIPRLPGQMWALPSRATAVTGLSDHMSPGDVAELKQSTAVALRVHFDGETPTAKQRYWRAMVLTEFDGRSWTLRRNLRAPQPVLVEGATLSYRMLLEPNNQLFVPALDIPLQSDLTHGLITADQQLVTLMPVSQLTAISVTSASRYRWGLQPNQTDRSINTALPAQLNPKATALAAQWRAESRDDAAYIQRLLNWFHNAAFYYTLTPPTLGTHGVDEFLFNTQRGFCEHYASAFTFLLRAVNIPARVVTGYQGGEFNPVSGYWIIRQSDAHAWVEAWLPDQGWVRFDPTAAIAPERVEQGLAVPDLDELNTATALMQAPGWLLGITHRWDALNTFWKERIVEFDKQKQQALLQRLGLQTADWRALGLALSIALAVFFLTLAGYLAWQQRSKSSALDVKLWQQLLRKLRRMDIHQQPHEGPDDFLRRAIGLRPDLGTVLEKFRVAYLALRYGPAPAPALLAELKQQLRKL